MVYVLIIYRIILLLSMQFKSNDWLLLRIPSLQKHWQKPNDDENDKQSGSKNTQLAME